MDKTANNLIAFATFVVLILSLVTLIAARPRRQVFVPYLPSLAVSIVIYRVFLIGHRTGGGASSFYTAFTVCSFLALGFALFLILYQPERDKLATFSWAMLGVVTPYVAFFVLLVAAG